MTLNDFVINAILCKPGILYFLSLWERTEVRESDTRIRTLALSPAERARESEKHAEQQNSFLFNKENYHALRFGKR